MKKQHPKYKIRKGDTLESISLLFGIEKDIWTRYHNNMCSLSNVIHRENVLPAKLEEIFLLPELWEKAYKLNLLTESLSLNLKKDDPIELINNHLQFRPEGINHKYGVTLNLAKNKVHYEMALACIGQTGSTFRLVLDRKQVYINDKEPDGKLYELANQMGKSIYPIIIDVNKQSREIIDICNYDEMKERCRGNIVELKRYFTGEYAERYIYLYEKQIGNLNSLKNHLQTELFNELYLLPVQQNIFDKLHSSILYQHTSESNIQTCYHLDIRLNPMYTDSGKIIALVNSREQLGSTPCFKAEYRLYPKDHTIFSIRGSLILPHGHKKLHTTTFEIYHLNVDGPAN